MINLNEEKCIGCGTCATVCATMAIKIEDGKPSIKQEACMNCGHCYCLCPTDALSVDAPNMDTAVAENDVEKAIISRRSIRRFKDETPAHETIERALRLASWAPSSKNQKANGWSVILGKDKVKETLETALAWCHENKKNRGLLRLYKSGINLITNDAPCLIFSWIKSDAINKETDCAIAMASAELMLQTSGIGTCWAGFAQVVFSTDASLLELIGVPEGAELTCCLMAGVPAETYKKIPERLESNIVWKD